ncbi:MAG: aminopeptidase P family protein [Clostridiaceae bacterium]|nr:aminopeptidase P family protein [Clostridiaceae bacterium]
MNEFVINLDRLQTAVAASAFDAVLLTSEENRFFVTGVHAEGIVIVSAEDAVFATDFRYAEAAARVLGDMKQEMTSAARPYAAIVNDFIASHQVRTLAFEGSLPYEEYVSARKDYHAELTECGTLLHDLRRVKQPFEQKRLIATQEITDAVFTEMLGVIRAGVSEKELALELYNRLLRHGAERLSFPSIVVSGENGSLCHGVPGERIVGKGEFVTLDFGCVVGGYCSDMTRTVAVGTPSEPMREVYGIVLQAQNAALAAAKPGVVGRDLDAVARKIITDAGYGPFFGHGLGHGLGILCHDTDGASPRNERVLPEGTVTTIEPGIYLPGRFGVRIEDVAILEGEGSIDITRSPKELIVL